jgi:hypothetical protein
MMGAYRVWAGKTEGKGPLEDPDVDGRIILRRIFRKWEGIMDWIDLAQDRDRLRAVVNAVIDLRVP